MSLDYTSPKYDEQRIWIKKARVHGIPWERIAFGNNECIEDLEAFLQIKRDSDFWEINSDDWAELVKSQKLSEERRMNISSSEKSSIISNANENNDITIPLDDSTCWQKYRKYILEEQKFALDDVDAIESSALNVLKRLNSDTQGHAIKGLVIGNVQSGKTANMSALMAMAADYGWNMFIVLSGTIENLRIQTQNRLISDLTREKCNVSWQGLPQLSRRCEAVFKAQNLNFGPGNHMRYLTVCLKNASRLAKLIQWLHEDYRTAAQMKILIIDDEADQAGINTKDITSDERTKINNLIVNLVGNLDGNNNKTQSTFKAMNYIGYTATPYANVLNEASETSLYPHDFISTLQVSKQYFGPQQLFGDRTSSNYVGLNIVREIDSYDLSQIRATHDGECIVPKSLEDAICWFLCCTATFRFWDYKKPVSMLIHTSQKQIHHEQIHKSVKMWFRNKKAIIDKCKTIWAIEINEFTKDDLFKYYPDFDKKPEDIKSYPNFDSIKGIIEELLNDITNIKLGDKGDFTYGRGIHICVDNCKHNAADANGTYLRLAYPIKENKLDFAPSFIVIGGATLSRGLTIEGLVSTYFLRSTKQADTLMQMGRWFGYRRGYELLQRLWITDTAERQFEFLADLDSELRTNISNMELLNKKPRDYAVIIKNSPSAQLITITNKNRMHSAILTEMNFSGSHNQTHLFVDSSSILEANYNAATKFINSLGVPKNIIGEHAKGSHVWESVDFNYIYDNFLEKFVFHNKLDVFMKLESIKDWVNSITNEGKITKWNVILYGINKGEKLSFNYCSINKVTRTRRKIRENTIDIGVLSDPKEAIADVSIESLPEDIKELVSNYRTINTDKIRTAAGLDRTPFIALYFVDRNSSANNKKSRFDMNTSVDVVGVSMSIPGDKCNNDCAESIMIDLKRFGFGCDVEDGEENED